MVPLPFTQHAPPFSIIPDIDNQWLHVTWHGPLTSDSIQWGCEEVRLALLRTQYTKVLNDSTLVTGDWTDSAPWMGNVCFKSLNEAGLQYLAWVYSTNCTARHSMELALRHTEQPLIATFDDVASAYMWLQKCDRMLPPPQVPRYCA